MIAGASLLAPAAGVAQTLSAADLTAEVASYRAYKPADAFSPPFDESSFIGKAFRIERPIRSGDSTGPAGEAMGFWTYNPRTQELRLVADTSRPWRTSGLPGAGNGVESIEGFPFLDKETARRSFVGKNGYGATFDVSEVHFYSEAVAEFSSTYESSLPKPANFSYEVTLTRAPDEARRLSQSARVVIEGRVVPYLPSEAIVCIADFDAATMDEPIEAHTQTCLISAEISRVAIEDSATGQVLAEWR
ncbi:MAG: hypothetical protein ACM3YN_09300 [Parcubacteria group bacterium]